MPAWNLVSRVWLSQAAHSASSLSWALPHQAHKWSRVCIGTWFWYTRSWSSQMIHADSFPFVSEQSPKPPKNTDVSDVKKSWRVKVIQHDTTILPVQTTKLSTHMSWIQNKCVSIRKQQQPQQQKEATSHKPKLKDKHQHKNKRKKKKKNHNNKNNNTSSNNDHNNHNHHINHNHNNDTNSNNSSSSNKNYDVFTKTNYTHRKKHVIWLVVWTPLKNMSSWVGMMTFPIYGKS